MLYFPVGAQADAIHLPDFYHVIKAFNLVKTYVPLGKPHWYIVTKHHHQHVSRKRVVMFFGWVFDLISLGSPRVLRVHMGHTCGEPTGIELTAAHGLFYRSLEGTSPATRTSRSARR